MAVCTRRLECGSSCCAASSYRWHFAAVAQANGVAMLMALWWRWRGCRVVGVVVEVAWLLSCWRCGGGGVVVELALGWLLSCWRCGGGGVAVEMLFV